MISGRNQVEIGSKSGPGGGVQLGRVGAGWEGRSGWGGPCSSSGKSLGYGLGVERFDRFRFSVPAVPLPKGLFLRFSTVSQQRTVRFRFRFLENGSGGSGSAVGFGKNGSDGSGPGSGSVPESPCKNLLRLFFGNSLAGRKINLKIKITSRG